MSLTVKKLAIGELRRLEQLVTENLESAEPGLKVIGTRLLLGHSRMDLVAMDGRRSLVLIALAFTADDATLLRMIDAYSWCLEYPDSVRQLYPAVRTPVDAPPRLLFVAERLPDAFLRKMRLLRLTEFSCFEFRYVEVNGAPAFYLEIVDLSRRPSGAAEGEGPAGPVPAPRPSSAPRAHTAPVPARAVQTAPRAELPTPVPSPPRPEPSIHLRRPDGAPPRRPPGIEAVSIEAASNGGKEEIDREEDDVLEIVYPDDPPPAAEAPAEPERISRPEPPSPSPADGAHRARKSEPERRRPQLSPSSIDEAKVRTVRDYLQRELPSCSVYDFFDFDRTAQAFHLQNSHGQLTHLAYVAADFLAERSEREIQRFLEQQKLAQTLRQAGYAGVVVTTEGVSVEGR